MHSVIQNILLVFLATTLLVQGQSNEVNSSCMTPNKKPGKCITIYDCSKLYDQLTNPSGSVASFIRESDCGVHDGLPLVCCGEDVDYDDDHQTLPKKRNRTAPTISLNSRFGESSLASSEECGFMFDQDKITNGIVTSIDEFPWMALLRYRKLDTSSKVFLCGGSLIGPRIVLTAAHCVTGAITKKYELIGVRLGEHNIQEEPDCIRYANFVDCADPVIDSGINRVIPHHRYDDTVRDKPYDIALIKLEQEITYTDFIRPICLPRQGDVSSAGAQLIVAGWGRTEKNSASAVKLKVRVPMTTRRYCRTVFRKAGVNIRDSQICAGGEQGRDSCTGDSGGPLMALQSGYTNQWYLEGIVSFGTICGTKGWPGVYTQVAYYLPWIQRTVENL